MANHPGHRLPLPPSASAPFQETQCGEATCFGQGWGSSAVAATGPVTGLLVIGARGAGLSSVLLGSVATRLAARASVPVLVIGDRVRKGQGGRLVDRAERLR